MCIINTFNYIYDSICFADNKIKLIDFTTKVELLENATNTSNANIIYNFDISKKILFYTPFYEWNDFTFGFGNMPFIQVN